MTTSCTALHNPTAPRLSAAQVPVDPLRRVFTADVMARWRAVSAPSDQLRWRIQVLEACGPYPSDGIRSQTLRALRAQKAAWETYLGAGFACGMFHSPNGADLVARLTGVDDGNFRAAIAECMTCWLLAGPLRLTVNPHKPGRGAKVLDLQICPSNVDIGVEVKAPFRERSCGTWCGDDADKIVRCLEAANKQFDDRSPNILAIVPILRIPVFAYRRNLTRAAFGERVISIPVNLPAGSEAPHESVFVPRGKFLRPSKPNGLPACRRISAILCIEERFVEKHPFPIDGLAVCELIEDGRSELRAFIKRSRERHYQENETWIDHHVLMVHNPFAYHPVAETMWGRFPQLVRRDDAMIWTDGYDGFV